METFIQELCKIKRHLNGQVINTEIDIRIPVPRINLEDEVEVIEQIYPSEECFVCFKKIYDVR